MHSFLTNFSPMMMIIAASLPFLTVANHSTAQEGPDPSEIYIENIRYRGPGCPSGSVASNLSDDGRALTLLFDSFIAEADGSSSERARTTCDLKIDMQVPPGWSFALFCIEFRGYASLDEGTRGVQMSYARVDRGSRLRPIGKVVLDGEFDDDYSSLSQVPLASYAWSPCGRSQTKTLNIRSHALVTGSPRSVRQQMPFGLMTVDSVDGELSHHYGITWRRCDRDGSDHRGGNGRGGRGRGS